MNLRRFKPDWIFLLAVFSLLGIGMIMIVSTSSVVGLSTYNDAFFFIKRHFIFLILGLIAGLIGFVIPHTFYKKIVSWGLLLSFGLLLLTLSPLGVEIGGAKRWLDLGFFRFQPVECVKFFVVVFVAVIFDRKKNQLDQFSKSLIPMLIVCCSLFFLILLQPDLGNIGLIAIVIFCLMFLSSIPIKYIATMVAAGIGLLTIIILKHSYQMKRVLSFLSPWDDPLGNNYHMVQSLIAIGIGGFSGVGIGESKLKYFYLPLQYSDFIFSIICEEGGFILAGIVILLYTIILFKGYEMAKKSTHYFGFYFAFGLTLLICIQAYINIAVVTGLIPVTGIPLTFISFGGTSLISSLFYVGVILNIATLQHDKQYDVMHKSS
tara:strand:+ start:6487 stop:7614 length:1128 start_codon:yes stop_codon:yes gene_type:complete